MSSGKFMVGLWVSRLGIWVCRPRFPKDGGSRHDLRPARSLNEEAVDD